MVGGAIVKKNNPKIPWGDRNDMPGSTYCNLYLCLFANEMSAKKFEVTTQAFGKLQIFHN